MQLPTVLKIILHIIEKKNVNEHQLQNIININRLGIVSHPKGYLIHCIRKLQPLSLCLKILFKKS